MKYHLAFIFGLLLLVIPLLGIPTSWKFLIIEILGAILMIVVSFRHYHKDTLKEENQSFSDSSEELEELDESDIVIDNEIEEYEEKDDY
jgi:hypothetical protein